MSEGWDIEKAIQNIKRRCHDKLYQSEDRGFDSDDEITVKEENISDEDETDSNEELIIDVELKSESVDNSREPFDASEFVETEMMPSLSSSAQVEEKLSWRKTYINGKDCVLQCLKCDYTTKCQRTLNLHFKTHNNKNSARIRQLQSQVTLTQHRAASKVRSLPILRPKPKINKMLMPIFIPKPTINKMLILQPTIVRPQTVQIVQPDGQLVQAAINNSHFVLPQQLQLNQIQTPFTFTKPMAQPQIVQAGGSHGAQVVQQQQQQQQQQRQINQLQTQLEILPEQQQQTTEDILTKKYPGSSPYYFPLMERQFYVGRAFTSYEDICKAKEIYEQQKSIIISKKDSVLIMKDYKKGIRKNTNYNEDLIYTSIAYQCKFGKPRIKEKKTVLNKNGEPKKKRNSPSLCTLCPFLLRLRMSRDGQTLRVIKIHEDHNHDCSLKFNLLRQQLDEETLEETKILLALNVDIKKVQRHLCSKGKMVTNRCLQNLKKRVKQEKKKGEQSLYSKDKMISMKDLQHLIMNEDKGSDSFEDVLALMMTHQNLCFEVMITKESACRGVYFQTEDMKSIFDMSSEILVIDTSYKFSEHKMPLYVMLCLDDNGESVVIALALAQYETKETLSWIAESFGKYNPNFMKVKYIMADKVMLERQELLNHFPNAQLLNCNFFNTIKTFKKEVTSTTKMNISAEEKEFCLEMFLNIVGSKDKDTCDSNITLLKEMAPEKVVEYFTKEMEHIKDEWTKSGVSSHSTFSKNEIFKGRLKTLIDSYSSVTQFVADLLIIIYFHKWKRYKRAIKPFEKTLVGPVGYRPSILQITNIASCKS